jgi:hypothetical protein
MGNLFNGIFKKRFQCCHIGALVQSNISEDRSLKTVTFCSTNSLTSSPLKCLSAQPFLCRDTVAWCTWVSTIASPPL